MASTLAEHQLSGLSDNFLSDFRTHSAAFYCCEKSSSPFVLPFFRYTLQLHLVVNWVTDVFWVAHSRSPLQYTNTLKSFLSSVEKHRVKRKPFWKPTREKKNKSNKANYKATIEYCAADTENGLVKERAHDLQTAGGGSERRSFYRQYFFLPFSSELHESSSRSLSSHFTRSLADCALHAMHIPRFFTTVKVLVVFTNFHHSSIFFSLSVFFFGKHLHIYVAFLLSGFHRRARYFNINHQPTRNDSAQMLCSVQIKMLERKKTGEIYDILLFPSERFCSVCSYFTRTFYNNLPVIHCRLSRHPCCSPAHSARNEPSLEWDPKQNEIERLNCMFIRLVSIVPSSSQSPILLYHLPLQWRSPDSPVKRSRPFGSPSFSSLRKTCAVL